jgi:hypothetical protein
LDQEPTDMSCRASRRAPTAEDGLTLTELIATIVIMGLVMAPLCTAFIQALKMIPQSGTRTQVATDNDRLLLAFSDDVAQTQLWVNQANTPGITATNTWFPTFSLRPTASVTGRVQCPSVATTTQLLTLFHSDPASSSPHNLWQDWQVVFTSVVGSPSVMMQVQRRDRDTTSSFTSAWDTLTTGYCTPLQTDVAVLTAVAPQAQPPTDGNITLVLAHLSDNRGNLLGAVSLQVNIRTSYS